jgi:ATP-dependent Lhr-like helicase
VPTPTAWSAAVAEQLLARYGVVTREIAPVENLPGGFGAVYDVLKTMEERGRVRRGYFAGGVGALQFAAPAALDMLRSLRRDPEEPEVLRLAATDPANPYGTLLRWPAPDSASDAAGRGPTRSAGAQVVLVNGRLAAFIGRNGKPIFSYLAEDEPDRSAMARAVAGELAAMAQTGERRQGGLLVAEVNGAPVGQHPLAAALAEEGFLPSPLGLHLPRRTRLEPQHRHPARQGARDARTTSSPFRAMARTPVSTLDDLDTFGDPVSPDADEAGESGAAGQRPED